MAQILNIAQIYITKEVSALNKWSFNEIYLHVLESDVLSWQYMLTLTVVELWGQILESMDENVAGHKELKNIIPMFMKFYVSRDQNVEYWIF